MVTLNPSQATKPISITTISTSIGISPLPSPIYETEPFAVSCQLVEIRMVGFPPVPTPVPLPGKTINFYYIPVGDVAVYVGNAVTDSTGVATLDVTIPTAGSYTMLYEFVGDATYAPTDAETGVFEVLVSYVDTTLTISAPSSVQVNESFAITGVLTRNDTGGGVPNQTISLSYNTTSLGSVVTDASGAYSATVSIAVAGSFTLKADFAGATGLGVSIAYRTLGVGVPPTLWLAVPIAVGLGAIYLATRK